MSSVESPAVAIESRSYLGEFAQLLKALRERNKLTVRELGERANYHHTTIVRAARGKERPNWELTERYLRGCGVSNTAIGRWHELWTVMDNAERELARGAGAHGEFWIDADQRWYEALGAVQQQDSLPAKLIVAVNLTELMDAVKLLAQRSGELWTLRRMEAESGISRSMLQRWFSGAVEPDRLRFEALVRALGATPAEQAAFNRTLSRVAGPRCTARHPRQVFRCVRNEYHRGRHRAPDESTWLDDGNVDGTTTHDKVFQHLSKYDRPERRLTMPDW